MGFNEGATNGLHAGAGVVPGVPTNNGLHAGESFTANGFHTANGGVDGSPADKCYHARKNTAGETITCKAAVVWGPGEPFVIEDVQVAPPQKLEVRIRILFTSICHTDLSAWKGENESQRVYPRILGHEASGVVESVGEGVTDLKEGDHVVPIFNGECGECAHCKSDKSNLCERYRVNPLKSTMAGDGKTRFFSVARRQPVYHFLNTSTFSEYTVLDAGCVVKIDAAAPLEKMCRFSCGLATGIGAAWNTADVREGSTVAIFGLGAVGLAVAEGARVRGASRIIGVDVNNEKLIKGREMGVTDFVNPKECGKPVSEVIKGMTKGGVDYSFECAGNLDVLREAFLSTHDMESGANGERSGANGAGGGGGVLASEEEGETDGEGDAAVDRRGQARGFNHLRAFVRLGFDHGFNVLLVLDLRRSSRGRCLPLRCAGLGAKRRDLAAGGVGEADAGSILVLRRKGVPVADGEGGGLCQEAGSLGVCILLGCSVCFASKASAVQVRSRWRSVGEMPALLVGQGGSRSLVWLSSLRSLAGLHPSPGVRPDPALGPCPGEQNSISANGERRSGRSGDGFSLSLYSGAVAVSLRSPCRRSLAGVKGGYCDCCEIRITEGGYPKGAQRGGGVAIVDRKGLGVVRGAGDPHLAEVAAAAPDGALRRQEDRRMHLRRRQGEDPASRLRQQVHAWGAQGGWIYNAPAAVPGDKPGDAAARRGEIAALRASAMMIDIVSIEEHRLSDEIIQSCFFLPRILCRTMDGP